MMEVVFWDFINELKVVDCAQNTVEFKNIVGDFFSAMPGQQRYEK